MTAKKHLEICLNRVLTLSDRLSGSVKVIDHTYPRVHASSISRSSKEDWEPVHRLLRHRHSRDESIDTTADDDANTPSYFAEAPKDFLAPNYYENEA